MVAGHREVVADGERRAGSDPCVKVDVLPALSFAVTVKVNVPVAPVGVGSPKATVPLHEATPEPESSPMKIGVRLGIDHEDLVGGRRR